MIAWIVLLPLPLLLAVALGCWLLSPRVPTRRLGYAAALAILLALGCVAWSRASGLLPLESASRSWLAAYGTLPAPVASASLGARFDALSLLFALVVLAGGFLGVLYLARSLAASLVGYGRLWSAILLMLAGVLAGLWTRDLLILVFGWGMAILGTALARRTVGGVDQRLPTALSTTAIAGWALLMAVITLAVRTSADPAAGSYDLAALDSSIGLPTFAPLLLALAAALGLPPFSRILNDDEGGPPALHGVLIALGLPILGVYTLFRILGASLAAWPQSWFGALAAAGGLALICGAAGALRAQRFGPLVGWQASAQLGLAMLPLGAYDPARPMADGFNATLVAISLILFLNALWSTLVAALALAALERRTGSDEISGQHRLAAPQAGGGLAYALAAASAIGIVPTLGFWPRRWLLDTAAPAAPWLIPLLLAGSGMLAISYLGPLTLFWRLRPPGALAPPAADSRTPDAPVVVAAALPLLLLGVWPDLILLPFIRPALGEVLPAFPAANTIAVYLPGWIERGSVLGLALLALAGAARTRALRPRPVWGGGESLDQDSGSPHAPQALGHTLRGLALLADPGALLGGLGRSLEWISHRLAWALQIVSGRYYLTGVLIAALTLVLLLVQ